MRPETPLLNQLVQEVERLISWAAATTHPVVIFVWAAALALCLIAAWNPGAVTERDVKKLIVKMIADQEVRSTRAVEEKIRRAIDDHKRATED